MRRHRTLSSALALLGVLALPGCATLNELAALHTLTFDFAGVSDVRLVDIPIGAGASFSRLGVTDAARLGAAVVSKHAPIDLIAHVSATNPSTNRVAARLVGLGWTLFVENRQALEGTLASPIAITPGATADVPLAVRFDLYSLAGGGARDLFGAAMAIAGQGGTAKELRLEMVPTVETSLGPIRFPAPVVVHRVVGGQ